jgi:arsenate reductase (thioredoxin)
MTRILILCTGNSCRSQMAEGYVRHFRPDFEVFSAGTSPAPEVHPLAIKVMNEDGVDIRSGEPKLVNQFIDQPFDYVITVCDSAKESCPVFIGDVTEQIHIGFEDPAMATGTEEEVIGVFRKVRDQIKNDFKEFLDSIPKST